MDKEETCLNCGTALQGLYCSRCGQKHINPNLTLRQLLGEFFEEFLTFDNRFFRTLKPLIFSPGKVTIDYNSGKRARYMPLLKLYLFVSFTLFLVMALTDSQIVRINLGDDHSMQAQEHAPPQQQEPQNNSLNKEKKKSIPPALKNFIDWLLRKKEERGKKSDILEKNVINRLPHMAFFLMPFFALLLKLFYWRSIRLYTHHLVFSIHYHTFTFIVFLAISLGQFTHVGIISAVSILLMFTLPLYMVVGLKKISRQSWGLTIIKTMAIAFLYFLVSIISMIVLVILSVAVF